MYSSVITTLPQSQIGANLTDRSFCGIISNANSTITEFNGKLNDYSTKNKKNVFRNNEIYNKTKAYHKHSTASLKSFRVVSPTTEILFNTSLDT